MKVLHVLSCVENGGTESYVLNIVKNVPDIQFDILVFTNQKSQANIFKSIGCKIFCSGVPTLGKLLSFLRNVSRLMKENGPYDVVHCHVNNQNMWPLFAARIAGVKKRVSHSHALFLQRKSLLRRLYDMVQINGIKLFATHYLACSKMAGESLYGKSFFCKNGLVVKNGIEVTRFSNNNPASAKLRREFNVNENSFVIGNITRFDDNKNTLFTIDVFAEILKDTPNAILILGGPDGGLLNKAQNRVQQLGIQRQVRFIGSRNDVENCLKIIDAYLFPSKSEGLGIAILEAQAAGCLCFVSNSIPKEADLGISSLFYISLSKPPHHWAKTMKDVWANWKKPTGHTIRIAFEQNGLNITSSAFVIRNIYSM